MDQTKNTHDKRHVNMRVYNLVPALLFKHSFNNDDEVFDWILRLFMIRDGGVCNIDYE